MNKIYQLFNGGGACSKGKGKGSPTSQEALASLRETEKILTKKQEYLKTRIKKEMKVAKKHGTRDKRVAMQALKRKKRYEKQLSQTNGTLSTTEFLHEALENSYSNTEVFKNMGYAAQAMKKVHENMNLDKIDEMMKDITEQQDIAQKITEALTRKVDDDFDEVKNDRAEKEKKQQWGD